MGLFKGRYHYITPERFTPAEARARRLTALLEKERRFAELPNFSAVREKALSQAAREKRFSLARSIVNDAAAKRHKADLSAAALRAFKSMNADEFGSLSSEEKKLYQRLRASQQTKQSRSSDRRRFHPEGKDRGADTVFGTPAYFARGDVYSERPDRFMSDLGLLSRWLPMFRTPAIVHPCIDRAVRREVMFAKGKAGRGYRVRHRRNSNSGIPC